MANPQMFVEVVTTGAQAAVTVVGHGDNVGDAFGDDEDFVIVLNSSANSANAAITDVLVGTPVTPGLAANSAILSNTTASGDILFAVADASGNSRGLLHLDASGPDINIPVDVGLTFGDAGEKIEGDGTNLVVESSGTLDMNSGGALTLDSGAAINLEPASGSVILLDGIITIDAGVVIPVATAHDAAGTAVSISAGATTAGTTADIAGGSLTLAGGQGKGTGAGGDIIFQTANAAGSTATSLNSLATALTISDDLSATFVGQVFIPTGSSSDPALAFSNDPDTGIYRSGGGQTAITGNTAVLAQFGPSYLDLRTDLHLNSKDINGAVQVRVGSLTASHDSTNGTNFISLFNGTAPAGNLTNGATIYCESGVMKVINADGTGGTIDFS